MNANSHYRKIEKCPKCTEAQSCDDAIQSETARVAARDANSRAESLTLELGNSVQRAAEAERRAFEAERRLSGWNFKFPATVLEPLSDPRLLIFIERTACIPNIPAAWDNFFASLPPWTRKKS
ncbi:hypothetical protein ACN42_g5102 [Penicillium freii]|uniref:Uncharacterized protein n=1 Tax=Penicillium freii TaxID=48697 RepID=A0A117NPA6_PENFR|nr:hypothetical protein ACN42_g5102 [Penicillium freii]